MKKVELNLTDRLLIGNLLPEADNITNMLIKKSILDKVALSEPEIVEADFKVITLTDKAQYTWKVGINKEIEFSDIELSLLKEQINILDSKKAITDNILELCIKIKEL
jgi:hypothetical protein